MIIINLAVAVGIELDGVTPGVLYEVDVPIMTNTECHNMFKKAGHVKRILDSFICAGYPEGKKDSCEVRNSSFSFTCLIRFYRDSGNYIHMAIYRVIVEDH